MMDAADNDFFDSGGDGDCFDDGMDEDDPTGPSFHFAETAATHQDKKRVTFFDSTNATMPSSSKPDPWECLDRDTTDLHSKPRLLRVGKTIVLPDALVALPSECVTGSRTRRVARKRDTQQQYHRKTQQQHQTADNFQVTLGKRSLEDALDGYSSKNKKGSSSDAVTKRPAISFTGLSFGDEFAYIANANAKRKAEERRALRQQQQRDLKESPPVQVPGLRNDPGDGGDGFGDGDGGDYNDEDDDYVYGGGGNGDCSFGDDDNMGSEGPILSNTGLASVDDAFQYNHNGTFIVLQLLLE